MTRRLVAAFCAVLAFQGFVRIEAEQWSIDGCLLQPDLKVLPGDKLLPLRRWIRRNGSSTTAIG